MPVLADELQAIRFKFASRSNRPFLVTVVLLSAFALALLTGCDLNTPPPVSYSLPGEEVLRDVPFNSTYTFAMAWNPDGNRLAVAEHAGAEASLMGLTVTNPRVKSLNFSSRYLRRFAAIPGRQVVVGETPEGELWTWSLQGGPSERFFAGPVQTPLWSLSESGEDLIYVPKFSQSNRIWQVKYANLRTGEERVLIDSAQVVRELKIFPAGSGALISYSRRTGNTTYSTLALYPLPSGQPKILLEGQFIPYIFVPSPDGKKMAFVRSNSSPYKLMIYDFQEGMVDSLVLIQPPRSDLVWMENGRWVAMINYAYFTDELRAYDLQTHNAIVLAQNLSFASDGSRFVLFPVADTVAFFVNSPQRVSVFDRTNSSFSTRFSETDGGRIASLAWDPTGDKIVVHVYRAGKISDFYEGNKDDWILHRKNYSLSSASLLPDGQNFLAVRDGDEVIMDALAFSKTKRIFRPRWGTGVLQVQAHPSGSFAGVVDRRYSHDQGGSPVYTCTLRVIDLSSNAIADTLALPGSDGEWQWMKPVNNGQLTGIWRAYQGTESYRYYYISLDERRVVPVHQSGKSAFAVVPGSDRFSVLEGDILRTRQLRVPAP